MNQIHVAFKTFMFIIFFTSPNFNLKLWDMHVSYTCIIYKFNYWIFLVSFLNDYTDGKLKSKEVSYHIEIKAIGIDFMQ